MIPKQLELFEYEGEQSFRQIWDLNKNGIEDACNDLIQLLNEAQANPPLRTFPITLFDIAKRRLRLDSNADIPPSLTKLFQTVVDQVRDERFRLKAKIEEQTEYRLVFVDDVGQTPINGGRQTFGFDIRSSQAGFSDDRQQLNMALGKVKKVVGRRPDLQQNISTLQMIGNLENHLLGSETVLKEEAAQSLLPDTNS